MQNRLFMPCPICAHNLTSVKPELWTHGGCGGVLYVDESAYVHCQKCGKTAHISKMHISCNCGRHHNKIPSRDDIAAAISNAKIGISNNSIKWYKNFVSHL